MQDEEEDDDDLDPEAPDESDMDSHDEPGLEVCPHCRKMIYDDTERCPHCGAFISAEDAPISRRGWIVIVAIVLLALIILTYSQWR